MKTREVAKKVAKEEVDKAVKEETQNKYFGNRNNGTQPMDIDVP
jgi:hypothetical protein